MARRKQKNRKKKSTKSNRRPTVALTAQNADKHVLYQKSVQDVEVTQEFMDEIFASRNSGEAVTMREDFCGTALLCSQWVKSKESRKAVGLDLDQPTLDWAMEHNISPLTDDQQKRISLHCQDVLEASTKPEFDIINAFNFSYWIFHERKVMLDYFKRVRKGLKDDGVFILDMHGGPDSQFQLEEPNDMGDFDYVWHQDEFDPITHRTVCHIHFKFRDRSKMEKAFTYEWRLWTLPELKDILAEAGFSQIDVWWDENNGDDEYRIVEKTENMEAWIAYIAAWK